MEKSDYLQDAHYQFKMYKQLADTAIARVDDEQFFRMPSEESSSIALTVKHMAGNMRSRWTDYLSTDGEKPDRHRDTEFEIHPSDSREQLMKRWETGWKLLFDALLQAETVDLNREIRIRTQPYTVMKAINRQLTHYAYHVGQIVLLAIQFLGPKWESLSVPRGRSEQFNAEMRARHSSGG